MHRLVLIRHGQSDWNRRNLFTGWTDVPLTEAGLAESRSAAVALKAAGFDLDVAFTSVLTRAIVTLHTVLAGMDRLWLPVHKHWRLNERRYGALQGLDKRRTAERHGDAMVALWRRSWDVPPPPIDPADPRSALRARRPPLRRPRDRPAPARREPEGHDGPGNTLLDEVDRARAPARRPGHRCGAWQQPARPRQASGRRARRRDPPGRDPHPAARSSTSSTPTCPRSAATSCTRTGRRNRRNGSADRHRRHVQDRSSLGSRPWSSMTRT